MSRKFITFIALALLLSACRIESNIILDINYDGSAQTSIEIGLDKEMFELFEQNGVDPGALFDELPDFGGGGLDFISRTDGDMTYTGVQTTINDLATFSFDDFGGSALSEFSYEYDESSSTVSAVVKAADIGNFGFGDLPVNTSMITGDIFSASVVINMPGNVVEHNADEVGNDGSLIWRLPLTGTKEIYATSEFGGLSFSWIWFVVGGVLIIGAIAAVAAVRSSKRDSERAVSKAVAPYKAELLSTEVDERSGEEDTEYGDEKN